MIFMRNSENYKFYILCIIPVLFVSLIAVAVLWQWSDLPIYPDEIAYRMISGRTWQDGLVQKGLLILCSANAPHVSWLYVPAAWVFSQYDRFIAPDQVRMGVMALSFSVVPAALWLGWRRRHILASVAILGGFIGTSGAVLVIARPEILLLCNVALVMVALALSGEKRKVIIVPTAVGLWGSFYLSSYVHLEGIMLFPLTFYAIVCLTCELLPFLAAFAVTAGGTLPLLPFSASLHHGTCTGYPGIAVLRQSQVFHFADIQTAGFKNWFFNKINLFIENISYLPGVIRKVPLTPYVPSVKENAFANSPYNIDFFISLSAYFLLIGAFIFTIFYVYRICFHVFKWKGAGAGLRALLTDRLATAVILLVLPVYAVLVYDAQNAFYRSAAFAVLLSCALVMGLADLTGRWRLLCWPVALLFLITAGMSWRANERLFEPIIAGYEQGGSLSLFRDWKTVAADVSALSRETVPPLNAGGIVVDDLTYGALRNRPNLTPITYLGLQISYVHLSAWAIVESRGLNGVIARCAYMDALHIPTPHRRRELCAVSRREWLAGMTKPR
ncbi:hypothetical protein GALL_253280 [mine drainage metagenome]|uniref:Glycosyltransferase RgtA/B/C/D-like domain-containing protein n=1 Tax=mine drainage metagenome TaxID=410659 RepID=A0A1J5RX62_9ZZZZ